MLLNIHLQNVGPFQDVCADFGPRLNLITGDNSLGKSLLLEVAWWALTGVWAAGPFPATHKRGPAPRLDAVVQDDGLNRKYEMAPKAGDVTWRYERKHEDLRSIVIHARVDGGFNLCDPIKYARGEGTRLHPLDTPLTHAFTVEQLWGKNDFSNGLVHDLETWYYKKSREWEILAQVLEVLSPAADEQLRLGAPARISVEDPREVPTLEMPYGTVPVTYASAGVKRILSLAYLLVWAWREHTAVAELLELPVARSLVLLIDEAESHLHPRWQRAILPSLLKVAEALNPEIAVQAFVSTHAPLVLASAEPLFNADNDALFLLELAGKEVALRRLDWARRGEVSSWLQSEVFGLDEARSLPGELAIEAALAALSDPATTEAQLDEHEHALAGVIGELDPVWVRWMWLRRERGAAS